MTEERRKDCAECKADLTKEIGEKLDKKGVRWFVGIAVVVVIAVWTGTYTMYAGSSEKREIAIEKNESDITVVEKAQIKISFILGSLNTQVENLKTGQADLETKFEKKIESQTTAIIDAIKALKE